MTKRPIKPKRASNSKPKRASRPKPKRASRPKRVLYDSLQYSNGWYCLDDVPFTVVAYSLHEDGWLTFEAEYRGGLEWGWRRRWYAPKKLLAEAQLKRGVIHGIERLWRSNGQLEEEGRYELGVTLHRKRWDEKGNLVEEFDLKETDSNYALLQLSRAIDEKRADEQ